MKTNLISVVIIFFMQTTFAFSPSFLSTASCQIGTDIVEGGTGLPAASCSESRDVGGFFPEKVDVDASGEARVSPLSVGVTVKAEVDAFDVFIDTYAANATASASLIDTLGITAMGAGGIPLPGGLMQVNALLSGTLMIEGNGVVVNSLTSGEINYQFIVGSAFSMGSEMVLPLIDSKSFVVPISVTVPWAVGIGLPVNMMVEASASATMFGDGYARTEIDFGNSLEWLGITNVTDASGIPVASFSAVGLDGTDYALNAVPVPAPFLLLGLPLMILCKLNGNRGSSLCPRKLPGNCNLDHQKLDN